MAPLQALVLGTALSVFGVVYLAIVCNTLSAVLTAITIVIYIFAYTPLKRTSTANTAVGAIPGAIPPMIGWATATGDVSAVGIALFLLIFLWTPPHFWALALLIRREYEAARVPMLPVVKGEAQTARSIVSYSLVLLGISLLPFLSNTLGVFYLVSALALGLAFVALAVVLRRNTTPANARRLFSFSLAYLALLFVAMALDPILF